MRGRERDGRSGATPRLSESSRLAARWRLTAGAAETLNQSLATLLGEASFLKDARRDPAALQAACERLEQEGARCEQLAGSLLARPDPERAPASSPVSDLAAWVRGLRPVLEATLSPRFALRLEAPQTPACVAGSLSDLETLVLLLVERCCHRRPAGGPLRLAVERGPDTVELGVEILARAGSEGFWQPPDPRFALEDARHLAAPFGAQVQLEETEEALQLVLRFPVG